MAIPIHPLLDEAPLAGRYEASRLIGAGAVADVYLARDRVLGRQVAVKVLRSDSSANPEFVERFKREARAAASLNHPNIVSIFDWGDIPLPRSESSHLYFIVMEYVTGANLKEVLRHHGPLAEGEALAIAAQAAAALHAAHEQGVIHRDVKPHNILLTADGKAKVTDFGIARAVGVTQLTSTNIVLGTAHYLSPEQAQARTVDARSDVYSLGAVLYEFLTGQELFAGSSPLEVALQHVNTPAPSPRRLRRDISPATEAVVERALAKNPDERYQSAEEMRLAVQQALDHLRGKTAAASTDPLPVVAEPPPRPHLVPRSPADVPADRTPAAWLLAVPLLIILIVAGVTMLLTRSAGLLSPAQPQAVQHSVKTVAPATPVRAHRVGAMPHRVKPTVRPAHAPQARSAHKTRPMPIHRARPAPAPPSNPAPVSTAATFPPAPVVAAVPTPGPAPTVVVATEAQSAGATPTAAVGSFYTLIGNHQFDQAAQFWSQNMVNTWGIEEGIIHRFSATTRLDIKGIRLVSQAGGHATVSVDLLEWKGASSTPQELIGTWDLVQGPSGWLLDQAHF